MRNENRKRIIWSAILVVLGVWVFGYWRTFQSERAEFQRDKLSDVALTLAGNGATDCGRVAKDSFVDGEYDVAQQQEIVDGCAVAAFKAHKPFIARFDSDTHFLGSKPSYQAYVGTSQGKLYVLSSSQPNLINTMSKKLILKPQIVQANGHAQLRYLIRVLDVAFLR